MLSSGDKKLFAYLSVDQDGTEGLMAYFFTERAEWIPMIGTDMARMKALRKTADDIARTCQITYKIVTYHMANEVIVLPGKPLPGDSKTKALIDAALKFLKGEKNVG